MRFEIVFLASRNFGPDSLGLVGRCGWFVLRALEAAESIAVVRLRIGVDSVEIEGGDV